MLGDALSNPGTSKIALGLPYGRSSVELTTPLKITLNHTGLPNPMYARQQLTEDPVLNLPTQYTATGGMPSGQMRLGFGSTGGSASGTSSGVQQYMFNVPGLPLKVLCCNTEDNTVLHEILSVEVLHVAMVERTSIFTKQGSSYKQIETLSLHMQSLRFSGLMISMLSRWLLWHAKASAIDAQRFKDWNVFQQPGRIAGQEE